MSHDSFFAEVTRYGVVPVFAIESVEAALPLADALLDGGLPVAEVTFRTVAAAEIIAQLARRRPALLVGAGTVLSEENVKVAKTAGARFAVAPGLNPAVVRCAFQAKLPFAPGVCTPSEIEQALGLGCRIVKFFPSEPSGGVEMVKALAAPYSHTGVRFMPTGGVNAGNLEKYLSVEAVAAVGGTWIAKPEDLAGGRWQTIRDRCREAVEIVRHVRGRAP
ncbi:MAG: bifunctional 4-hydroxy-2-oxoglutarate aldolase/2-dehydro-3-deoxy-phosphogluconate aldolase [Thermoguttaceae bacterium]|jgi:2-dehydro-3-deoxyphosphogluconate aldolase/(4S)-4-hydroxy-2-oxoglutarate aldolase